VIQSLPSGYQDLMAAPDTFTELDEVQQAATVAFAVLRRALVEGAPVTREAITHEAAIVYATDPAEALSRLDSQAEVLGISSLV
jgi:hypothetical protein